MLPCFRVTDRRVGGVCIERGVLAIALLSGLLAVRAYGCGAQTRHPTTASGSTASLPAWLRAEIARRLRVSYENAKPTRIETISYPRTIAVVLTFAHTITCVACSAPSNNDLPHGKVLRISFEWRTHAPGDSLRFCKTRTACLVH
jgi:hypothetical protein